MTTQSVTVTFRINAENDRAAAKVIDALLGDDDRLDDAGVESYETVIRNDRAPRTVLDRAYNGRDIAALALNGTQHLSLEDYETGLVDALANLMHFARRYELDFDAALGTARMHHDAEAPQPWDEVPD
jgi:hypothetical protein